MQCNTILPLVCFLHFFPAFVDLHAAPALTRLDNAFQRAIRTTKPEVYCNIEDVKTRTWMILYINLIHHKTTDQIHLTGKIWNMETAKCYQNCSAVQSSFAAEAILMTAHVLMVTFSLICACSRLQELVKGDATNITGNFQFLKCIWFTCDLKIYYKKLTVILILLDFTYCGIALFKFHVLHMKQWVTVFAQLVFSHEIMIKMQCWQCCS